MSMSLKFENKAEVEAFLQSQAKRFQHVPGPAVRKATALVLRNIKQEFRRKGVWKTGTSVRSVSMEVRQSRHDEWEGRVGSWMPHMPGLEDGTKPHEIVPRRKRALRWMVGKTAIYARRVRHPGTKAYHLFRDGLAASVQGILDIFEAAVKAAGRS